MSLLEKLTADMKTAMKSRDQERLNAIRLLISQLKYARMSATEDLTPDQELAVLMNAAKKLKEAIEIYQKSNRSDLLEKEQRELAIVSGYLPEQISEEELDRVVSEIIASTGAAGMSDLGKVMGEAMKVLKGKADGKIVQQVVRRKLA